MSNIAGEGLSVENAGWNFKGAVSKNFDQHVTKSIPFYIEGCLEFYYFLRKSEAYEQTFKSLCYFRWNSKTKTATLTNTVIFSLTKNSIA